MTADDRIYYLYEDSTWGDLLTSYDGKAITYDTVGNMLSDGTWTYNWIRGRTLSSMHTSSDICFFNYDTNGLRTKRYGSFGTYTYTYVGDRLTHMTYGTTELYFAYHADGKPLSVRYNGTSYYYALNLQGDVVAILNSTGTAVVHYIYDAWGRLIRTEGDLEDSLGRDNPLRYRGYVYDRETGLYYLQSRYYNPTLGRFINADDIEYLGADGTPASYNLFAYCKNNPNNYVDPFGKWTISFSIGGDVTAFFFGVSISIGIAFDDNGNIAIQWSYSAPNYLDDGGTYNTGLLDAGVGVSLQVTDDDTIYDLEGAGSYAGLTAGNGLYGGIDLVYSGVEAMDKRAADTLPNGIQVSFGFGVGVDVHFRQTQTSPLWIINQGR